MIVSVRVPLKLTGSQNARENRFVRAARVKREKSDVTLMLRSAGGTPSLPCVVELTRVGPGTRKLDGDNLLACCKAVRDAVAKWLGVDDGDRTKVRWAYKQERGSYAVIIRILPKTTEKPGEERHGQEEE